MNPAYPLAMVIILLPLVVLVLAAAEVDAATINGHDCIRDMESTLSSAFDLAASYPKLISIIDVGDSYIKYSNSAPDVDYDGLSADGYDIYAVNVTAPSSTSSSSMTTRARMMITSGVHAREYAPPELSLRFMEYLATGYEIDPDVTWMLQHTEVHFILHVNPDGRYVAEHYPETMRRKNLNDDDDDGGETGGGDCRAIGVDVNRNFDFMWGDLSGGNTSDDPCDDTYHGRYPESETETRAVAQYARDIFPTDQRKDDIAMASGEDISGIFVDVHSSGEYVYFPWGYANVRSPDDESLQALGRKVAYFPNYRLWGPGSDDFAYAASGDSSDYMYGKLGVASFGLEIGLDFYEDCDYFENAIVPKLLPSLLYAAKIANRPFHLVKGPDIVELDLVLTSSTADDDDVVNVVAMMAITVVASDSRMANGYVTGEQGVAYVRLYVDVHPNDYNVDGDDDVTFDMVPSSSSEDGSQTFVLELNLPNGLVPGRHVLFVQATDGDGYVGPVSSAFFDVEVIAEDATSSSSPATDAPTAASGPSSSSPSTDRPTYYPTLHPSVALRTNDPSSSPTSTTSSAPTTPSPSDVPTVMPSDRPTTGDPSHVPTSSPETDPSEAPSAYPSNEPSARSSIPTSIPTTSLPLRPTTIQLASEITQANASVYSAAGPVTCSSIAVVAISLAIILAI
jgi:hypothetical protein